jgi:hypothetical protein
VRIHPAVYGRPARASPNVLQSDQRLRPRVQGRPHSICPCGSGKGSRRATARSHRFAPRKSSSSLWLPGRQPPLPTRVTARALSDVSVRLGRARQQLKIVALAAAQPQGGRDFRPKSGCVRSWRRPLAESRPSVGFDEAFTSCAWRSPFRPTSGHRPAAPPGAGTGRSRPPGRDSSRSTAGSAAWFPGLEGEREGVPERRDTRRTNVLRAT